jgi:hypothetical protein
MTLREKIARAIWEKRPDGGLAGRKFPFADNDKERRTYAMASLDNGKVAACDLCFDYADAALKIITEDSETAQSVAQGSAPS